MAKKKVLSPLSFQSVQQIYKVKTPNQVKQAIIWQHVQAIMLHLYGESPHNRTQMQKYNLHWQIAEKEENRKGAR